MSLSTLPNKLLLLIISHIDSEASLASLARTTHTLYNILTPHLYHRNATYSQGSALLHAVQHSQLSTAQKAIQAGANVNAILPPPEHRPLINFAAKSGNTALVKLLLDASADITSKDILGLSTLHLAALHGHLPIVNLLLSRGADPTALDTARRTPLYMACIRGHLAVAEAILAQESVDLDLVTVDEENPLTAAVRQGHTALTTALLERGAYAGTLRSGRAPVHIAVSCKLPRIARQLVNRDDVNVNVISDRLTPLQVAVQAGREDLVDILLTDRRVNPDLTTLSSGRTPLLEAALRNQHGIVRRLLDAGANPRIMDQTWLSGEMLLEAPSVEVWEKLVDEHSLYSSKYVQGMGNSTY